MHALVQVGVQVLVVDEQAYPEEQVPQDKALPQPSVAAPQLNPCLAQVRDMQLATQAPSVQVDPVAQLPQDKALPQPSVAAPQ